MPGLAWRIPTYDDCLFCAPAPHRPGSCP